VRYSLQLVRESNGFLIQVVERGGADRLSLAFGNAQALELEIAQIVGVKAVRVSDDLELDKVLDAMQCEIQGLNYLHISEQARGCRETVLQAVELNGMALELASSELQGDRSVVSKAVQQCGHAFKYASGELKTDQQFVLEMITHDPRALSAVAPPLSQQQSVLECAGLWQRTPPKVGGKIILSVPFSLKPGSAFFTNEFNMAMNAHPYFKSFDIYNPNFLSKGFCGISKRMITSKWWPCRGNCVPDPARMGKCTYGRSTIGALSSVEPTAKSCWRYSFHWHQQHVRAAGGVMLQILDYIDEQMPWLGHRLGAGQSIELDMAKAIGLKVVTVKRNDNGPETSQRLRSLAMKESLNHVELEVRGHEGS